MFSSCGRVRVWNTLENCIVFTYREVAFPHHDLGLFAYNDHDRQQWAPGHCPEGGCPGGELGDLNSTANRVVTLTLRFCLAGCVGKPNKVDVWALTSISEY